MSKEAANESAPQQKAASRLLGVYPQRQEGLFMQRIRVRGGRITWPQWRKVAELASLYSGDFPIHITTRQDIELHNIAAENIFSVQQGLREAAVSTFGAGGDSVRNITVCTRCDFCRNGIDIMPVARFVGRYLEKQPFILNLPRKFKISFSGCEQGCAKPWLNDLGFVVQSDGFFTVIGGGSLGPRPGLGIYLYKNLPAKDIVPLCVASVEFFKQCGNRENRHRARFRHLRETVGDEVFRTELDVRFNQLKASQSWPDISPAPGNKNIKLLHRLQLPDGNISVQQAVELSDIAEAKGAEVRINLDHSLELCGPEAFRLAGDLAVLASNPTIVACPGSATCTKGLVNCWAAADEIRRVLAGRHLPEAHINISGCPNNCAHAAVADIGLVGLLQKRNGKLTESFRLFTGGGNGRNDKLAKQSEIIYAEDIAAAVKGLLEPAKSDDDQNQ